MTCLIGSLCALSLSEQMPWGIPSRLLVVLRS